MHKTATMSESGQMTQERFELDGMTWQDVADTFELMEDWEDRYRFVIELGRKLPALPDGAYSDANKVRGCQSQVWMISDLTDTVPRRLHILGDSDAHIVKGLVALLLLLYSDRTPDEIEAIDARARFKALDLEGHLSSQRANCLLAMIDHIRSLAHTQQAAGA